MDITIAALSGLWLQPSGCAAGMAQFERLPAERLPAAMVGEIQRWRETYPRVAGFIERVYRDERLPTDG